MPKWLNQVMRGFINLSETIPISVILRIMLGLIKKVYGMKKIFKNHGSTEEINE